MKGDRTSIKEFNGKDSVSSKGCVYGSASADSIINTKIQDAGPQLANDKDYSEQLLSHRQRLSLVLSWIPSAIVAILYLAWWLYPTHHICWPFSLGATYIVMYELLAPFWLHYFSVRAIQPNRDLQPQPNWRVAMVVTKAPSEPWELVRNTLIACLSQSVPHDTWLADEAASLCVV